MQLATCPRISVMAAAARLPELYRGLENDDACTAAGNEARNASKVNAIKANAIKANGLCKIKSAIRRFSSYWPRVEILTSRRSVACCIQPITLEHLAAIIGSSRCSHCKTPGQSGMTPLYQGLSLLTQRFLPAPTQITCMRRRPSLYARIPATRL